MSCLRIFTIFLWLGCTLLVAAGPVTNSEAATRPTAPALHKAVRAIPPVTMIPSRGPAPTQLVPANGATNVPRKPTISWAAVTGATGYKLQVSVHPTDFSTSNRVVGLTLNATSYFVSTALEPNKPYYWRVKVTDPESSGWSPIWSFTTANTPDLTPPILTAPANGSDVAQLRPTLQWTPNLNADSYKIQVSDHPTDFSGSHLLVDEVITTVNYSFPFDLTVNGTYYWKVKARSTTTANSDWSAVWSFTVVEVNPPGAPLLVSPANNVQDVELPVTLTWNAVSVEYAENTITYHLQVDNNANFSSPEVNQAGLMALSYQATTLVKGVTYYWRVRSTNAGGNSSWSTVWNFTTMPLPPAVPVLTAPANGATNLLLPVNLDWNASTGADSYHIQVDNNANFSSPVINQSGLTATNFSASTLSEGVTYYWRVLASNVGGNSNWSAARSFTTKALPAVPVLTAPANGANNLLLPVTLDWNASTGAASYQIQVDNNANFSSPAINQSGLTATDFSASTLSKGVTYYWRVRASNTAGNSGWSSSRSFTTKALPAVPALTAPANGVVDVLLPVTLDWNASTGANSYHIQVDNNSNFSSPVVNQGGLTATDYPATTLSEGVTYYWRVRSANTAGNSAWSAARNFTTELNPPIKPLLISPTNNTVGATFPLTLTWSASANADTYTLLLDTDFVFSGSPYNQSGLTGTSIQVTLPAGEATYFWRVIAVNAAGNTYSSMGAFSTASTAQAPTLASPADGAQGVSLTPQLQWQQAMGSNVYFVQISTSTTFSGANLVRQAWPGATSYTVPAGDLQNEVTYYWRAKVWGSYPYSAPRSFTTVPLPPAVPVLTTPANGAVDVLLPVTLDWNAATGADSYQIQVDNNSNFSSPVVNQSGVTATNYQATTLSEGVTYYWRVRSTNLAGNSGWSSSRSFTTKALPAVPVLTAPANGAVDVLLPVTLDWNAATGAVSYQIQVDNNSNFSSPVVNQSGVTATTYQATTLAQGVIYYWRVRSANTAGNSTWSAARTFTTLSPPAVPVLAAPSNGAVDVLLPVTLVWNAATGANSYHVQVSTDASFSPLLINISGVTATDYQATSLSEGVTYYWRVRSANAAGNSSWPAARNFTTELNLPVKPVLSSPSNGTAGVTVPQTFTWQALSNADTYTFQLIEHGVSGNVVYEAGLTGTSYTLTTQPPTPGTYWWRVRAHNAAGAGLWAAWWTFTTAPMAEAPVLTTPSNGAVNVSLTPTFQWQMAQGGHRYVLDISRSTTFSGSDLIYRAWIAGTSHTVPAGELGADSTYYWRVKVQGAFPWSAPWSFTTMPLPPPAPVLTAPSNGAVDVSLPVTLDWNAAAGANSYHLQVDDDPAFISPEINQSGVTATNYQATTLTEGVTYHWRVRSANAGGNSAWSSARSFTTDLDPPAAPLLGSPPHGADGITSPVMLTWQSSSGADSYDLQVSESPYFTSLLIDQAGLTNTSYAATLPAGTDTYYWRVRAENAAGASPWSWAMGQSAAWTFTTAPTAQAPVLTAPPDGAEEVSVTPTLSWQTAQGASVYRLQISRSPNLSNELHPAQITGTSYTMPSGILDQDSTYYWRVKVIGSYPYSVTRSFNTGTPPNNPTTPPDVPVLSAPAPNANGLTVPVFLEWEAANGADTYELQVDAVEYSSYNFFNPLIDEVGLTGTDFNATTLSNGTVYAWRVRARNAVGVSDWSTVRKFSTPMLVAPPDAALVPTPVTLSWNFTDPIYDPNESTTSFIVELNTTPDFVSPLVSETVTGGATSYLVEVPPLVADQTYYWQVSAIHTPIGLGPSLLWPSEIRSFTTIPTEPSVPILSAPDDGDTDVVQPVTVSWLRPSGAETYDIQFDDDPAFNSMAINEQGLTETEFEANGLLDGTTYFWRVRAVNGVGPGDWATPWLFTTLALPDVPDLSAPADESTDETLPVTLFWDAAAGATSYNLQVHDDPDFVGPLVNETGLTGLSFQANTLENGKTYFWRVRGVNAAGNSAWSAPWTFSTEQGSFVRVTSPNGGEWAIEGVPYEITWESNDISNEVDIDIIDPSGNPNGITGTIPNTGSFSWTPDDFHTGSEHRWGFRVRISDAIDSSINDESDYDFGIGPNVPIDIQSPNGGEVWGRGEDRFISWVNNLGPVAVDIWLMKGENHFQLIKALANAPAESHTWRVKNNIPDGDDYRVMMVQVGQGNEDKRDVSNGPFTIGPPGAEEIEVIKPQEGDQCARETLCQIRWAHTQGRPVTVELYIGTTTLVDELTTGDDDGHYNWVVPPTQQLRSDYQIRISDNHGLEAFSGAFEVTLAGVPNQVELVSPGNGNDNVDPATADLVWDEVDMPPAATNYEYQLWQLDCASNQTNLQSGIVPVGTTSVLLAGLAGYARTYYWRVRATNGTGEGPWSVTRMFRTIADPQGWHLISPDEDETEVPLVGPLVWEEHPDACSYVIRLDEVDGSLNYDPTVVGRGTTTFFIPPGILNGETEYSWYVTASRDLEGNAQFVQTNETRRFTTEQGQPTEPIFTINTTLLDFGNVDPGTTADQVFTITNAGGGTLSGTIMLNDNGGNVFSFVNSVLSFDLPMGGMHQVTVRFAPQAAGQSYTGEVGFNHNAPTSPDVLALLGAGTSIPDLPPPINPVPTDQATGVPLEPLFQWGTVTGALEYNLVLDDNSDFNSPLEDVLVTTNSFALSSTPTVLLEQTPYYWQVRSCSVVGDPATCGDFSPGWMFTTGTAGTTPPVPDLVSPPNDAYLGLVTTADLEWQNVSADTYTIEVDDDPLFGSPQQFPGETGTTLQVTELTLDTWYHWRVMACNDPGGCSDWSQDRRFFTGHNETQRYYYLKDHLGSVRVTLNEENVVVHFDDYYPFGAPMPGRSMETPEAPRERFTGHEVEDDIDPNDKAVYYAGARYYDGLIGRWGVTDPLDEFHSPYVYVGNSPLILIDPSGMSSANVEGLLEDCNARSQDICRYDAEGNFTGGESLSKSCENPPCKNIFVAFSGMNFLTSFHSVLEWPPGIAKLVGTIGELAGGAGIPLEAFYIVSDPIGSDAQEKMARNEILRHYEPGSTNLVLYGFSWGGDSVAELTSELEKSGIFADLIITIDSADGPLTPYIGSESPIVLGPNTIHNNYWQGRRDKGTGSGRTLYGPPSHDIFVPNARHTNMADKTFSQAVADIMLFLFDNN